MAEEVSSNGGGGVGTGLKEKVRLLEVQLEAQLRAAQKELNALKSVNISQDETQREVVAEMQTDLSVQLHACHDDLKKFFVAQRQENLLFTFESLGASPENKRKPAAR